MKECLLIYSLANLRKPSSATFRADLGDAIVDYCSFPTRDATEVVVNGKVVYTCGLSLRQVLATTDDVGSDATLVLRESDVSRAERAVERGRPSLARGGGSLGSGFVFVGLVVSCVAACADAFADRTPTPRGKSE